LYYKWQERFFAGALEGFKQGKDGPSRSEQRKLEEQSQKIDRMKDVIAEITAENIALKKHLGIDARRSR